MFAGARTNTEAEIQHFETPPVESIDAKAMAGLLQTLVKKLQETATDLDRTYAVDE